MAITSKGIRFSLAEKETTFILYDNNEIEVHAYLDIRLTREMLRRLYKSKEIEIVNFENMTGNHYHYVNILVLMIFSTTKKKKKIVVVVFLKLSPVPHKNVCCGCVLEFASAK